MRRVEILSWLGTTISDELVITRVGPGALQWGELAQRGGNLYGAGLGLLTAAGLGMAMSLPNRRVICIDSDGGILMGVGVLATIGNVNPPNLTVIICDNGVYGSTGGQPTATGGASDLARMAQGAGIGNVRVATDVEQFQTAVSSAAGAGCATFIVAKVAPETKETESAGYILGDGRENMYRFVRYVERTQGKRILRMAKPGRFDADLLESLGS